jgi:tyrosyl-tRNA synthetase
MGGDLEKIKLVGKYFQQMWNSFGIDQKKIEYVWASDIIPDPSYWSKVINIAKITTLARTKRCMPIMGRSEDEVQYTAAFFYPMMQAADIFHLGVDICQLGADQRHANILAREVGPKLGWWKPVICHHHMLIGLSGPEKMGIEFSSKMSKSKPMSAIYVHDSPDLIKKKISQAFCPEKVVEDNPLIEYSKYLIFPLKEHLEVHRPSKFGGDITFNSAAELEKTYREGKLHPMDLKNAVAESLADLLKPCRDYFERHPEFLEVFKTQAITR